MRKINIYFGKDKVNSRMLLIENVEEKKVITFNGGSNGLIDDVVDLYSENVIEKLKEHFNELIKTNSLNNFTDMIADDNLHNNDILNEFELTKIAEYEEK